MWRVDRSLIALACVALVTPAAAEPPMFGEAATPAQVSAVATILPTGQNLPPGHGTVQDGAAVYANACAACHGAKLEGIATLGAPALVGGRGTLATAKPIKTAESYWPQATTLFEYIKHAMPFNAPGSLSDDEVYAVTAYVLASGHVIDEGQVLDATTLPQVAMPNRDGFVPDPRPKI